MSVLVQDDTLERERFIHFVGQRWKHRNGWVSNKFKFNGRDTWVCLSLQQDVPIAAQSWQNDVGWMHLLSMDNGANVYSDIIVKVRHTEDDRKWNDALRELLKQVSTNDIKNFLALNPSATRCHQTNREKNAVAPKR